jgi:hypothetical protein
LLPWRRDHRQLTRIQKVPYELNPAQGYTLPRQRRLNDLVVLVIDPALKC